MWSAAPHFKLDSDFVDLGEIAGAMGIRVHIRGDTRNRETSAIPALRPGAGQRNRTGGFWLFRAADFRDLARGDLASLQRATIQGELSSSIDFTAAFR